jgi:hypothetical protein
MKDCYVRINRGDPVTGARIANSCVFTVTRLRIERERDRASVLDRARMLLPLNLML